MSPDAMREAIAVSLGWKWEDGTNSVLRYLLPNYPGNVQAAQDLLNVLANDGWECESLVRVYKGWRKAIIRIWRLDEQALHQASGAHESFAICEAYLKAKGLWKEGA